MVGVGLVRNIAPLMSAMAMAGLLGATFTAELRRDDRDRLDHEANWRPERIRDRDAGPDPGVPPAIGPGRLAASRMIAAILAGPVMGLWASLVGITVGFGVAAAVLKVTVSGFFDMFIEMLWVRDVVSIALKGMAFGLAGSWFACFEGLRPRDQATAADPGSTAVAAVRATSLAGLAILLINSAWFLLFYHAGPAFGPTVLRPPGS